MRDSTEAVQDDSRVQIRKKPEDEQTPAFKRCYSDRNFYHLQQMEKNYSKLGNNGIKPKELSLNGRIKVHSLGDISLLDTGATNGVDGETVFAGRRDVSDPNNIKERQIVSRKGSIRGFKNRVRAGIATFIEENAIAEGDEEPNTQKRNYRQTEKGKIIIYTTSMTVVRESAEKCNGVRKILQGHMVRYEEKDLFMSMENQNELQERLGQSAIVVPQVFADGVPLGGFDEIQGLNESGELRSVFENFTKILLRSSCDNCGGYRYLPCPHCHGSKKSLHRNEFTEEFCALRCMQCDENGLVRCDDCIDQQE